MHQIKIYLNKLQWQWLVNELVDIAEITPVLHFEAESCLLAEMYRRRLHAFTFYKPGKMGMCFTFSASEAFAINKYFSRHSNAYNTMVRMLIEPKLLPGKPFPWQSLASHMAAADS